jgi:MFS family permease
MAFIGGTAMLLLIKDGPYRKASNRFSLNELRKVFSVRPFQTAAFGYFGHMWELYAFWAFVPWLLNTYQALSGESFSIPLWSFLIIASGFLGCELGGLFSLRWGSKPVALVALLSSGICCVLSFKMYWFPPELFFAFVLFWGFMVVADSPQFSALMAFYAPPQIRGTAITIATSIGFSITIFSIQLLNYLKGYISAEYLFIVLSLGPAFGILLLWRKLPV